MGSSTWMLAGAAVAIAAVAFGAGYLAGETATKRAIARRLQGQTDGERWARSEEASDE